MPKKLTYEHVKSYIESFEGYKLLSEEYENSYTYLHIQCPNNHDFWRKWDEFRKGKGCYICSYEDKNSQQYLKVKKYIEECGYWLKSEDYINNNEKLEITCPLKHNFWMNWHDFLSGSRCPICAEQKRKDAKKLDFKYVKNFIESFEGYKLLSENYINYSSKLKIICPNNHIFEISFGNFKNNRRCPECRKYNLRKRFLKQYDEVKLIIEEEGYKLLSKKYINAHSKLKIMCPNNHVFEISFNSFQSGHRCPKCAGNKKLTNQEIIELLKLYEDIRENKEKDIEVTCAYCGEWFVPERSYLTYRILYVNGKTYRESRMYCSQQCKDNCPIFKQRLYPKDFKLATSREVQPQLRQMVFERDNYKCQRCGWHKDDLDVGLHCHHIYPLNEDPIQSADVDTCITYCENCHKWIHQNVAGCGYGEMRC